LYSHLYGPLPRLTSPRSCEAHALDHLRPASGSSTVVFAAEAIDVFVALMSLPHRRIEAQLNRGEPAPPDHDTTRGARAAIAPDAPGTEYLCRGS